MSKITQITALSLATALVASPVLATDNNGHQNGCSSEHSQTGDHRTPEQEAYPEVRIARAPGSAGNIAKNDSIFVDGKSFNVVTGNSKGEVSDDVKRWGARELGPGALIFRSDDKLYIVDFPTRIAGHVSGADTERQLPLRDPDNERQHSSAGNPAMREQSFPTDAEIEQQRPRGLRDTDYDRQRSAVMRQQSFPTDAEIEQQRPRGLRDTEYDRQRGSVMREQSFPTDAQIEQQRPRGLRDTDYDRQRSSVMRQQSFPTDAEIEQQRPRGLRDTEYDRQRGSVMREQSFPTDAQIEQQRPRGLRDTGYDRQRFYPNQQSFPTDAQIEQQRPRGLRDADSQRLRSRDSAALEGYPVYIDDPDYAYYKLKKVFEENWNTNLPK